MNQTLTACPECRTALYPEPGFVNWCTGCEWNLEPESEALPKDLFSALYRRLSEKGGKLLYNSLKTQNLMQAPAHDLSWWLAMALSLLVLLVYPLPWLAGAGLVIFSGGKFFLIISGLLLLSFGYLISPERSRTFPQQEIVPRAQLPQLYALIDQAADLLDAPRIDGLILTTEFNASVAEYGWRRRKVLFLGLTYWELLSPQERLGLLGHELGHLVNGDPLRKRLPMMALDILIRTGKAICPESMLPRDMYYGRLVIIEQAAIISSAQFLMIPFNWLLFAIAQGFWGIAHGLMALLWAGSQRAEYRADLLGMQLSGLEAAISELEKMAAADLIRDEVRQQLVRRSKDAAETLFEQLCKRWNVLPVLERERRLRLLRRENHRLDATHPATAHRMDMLRLQSQHVRQLQISGRDWTALAHELAPFRKKIASQLLDEERSRLHGY